MNLNIKLAKNSTFNNEEHFFYCLDDLLDEWEEIVVAKEMGNNDIGFNDERLEELKRMIRNTKLKFKGGDYD